ncbi:diguanylate cyclase [Neiella marina]|uniref:Diguanylate cyclase n=1 Tax=Neiella holothuriorum TaxID=2870530 RepID=A0ABS7ED32_9GAMM|nr:sensor domain-containing diguanylate cyclase [Neiella holothuriorum]MBW8189833.1 diguanylate cyclase [Neiella holothuriorum]
MTDIEVGASPLATFNMLIDSVIVVRTDSHIEFANEAAHNMFGYQAGKLMGIDVKELMPKSIADHHDNMMLNHGSTIRNVGRNRQVLAKRHDGSLFPIEIAISKQQIEQQHMFVGVIRDMSDRVAAEAQSRERMHMLTMSEQMAGIGYWSVDLISNKVSWSEQVYRIHDVDPRDYQPSLDDAVDFYHPDDRDKVKAYIEEAIAQRQSFEFELRIINSREEVRYVRSKGDTEVNSEGDPVALFGVFQDVTEYKLVQQQLEFRNEALQQTTQRLRHQAHTDNLTGLNNRRAFFAEMKGLLKSLESMDGGLGVLMLDIDHFKHVNDTFGHDVGDKVLMEVAEILGLNTRGLDMVARLGGEEFVVVLPNSKSHHIAPIAERYRVTVENGMPENLPELTISIGTTFASAEQLEALEALPANERTEMLLKHADVALYRAKNGGRNQVQHNELTL